MPQKSHWKGLYVIEADERSELRHTEILNTTALEDSALTLTGGVTFYEADVLLQDVRILGSIAEDALNIVRSRFELSNVEISDTSSDALDSDFSNGTLRNVAFERVGGDALDRDMPIHAPTPHSMGPNRGSTLCHGPARSTCCSLTSVDE